jgi:transcriptional regulator with XRE-family HTH domain
MDRSRPDLQLGPAIRSLRRRQGMSQASLASSAYMERSNLSRIECNQSTPNVLTLARILRALGVESIYLRLREPASISKKSTVVSANTPKLVDSSTFSTVTVACSSLLSGQLSERSTT